MPMAAYTAATPPAICAMPQTMIVMISLRVIRGTYGRMTSGASVCPIKIFAAADSVSLPLVPMALRITQATARTTRCKIPQ